MKPNSNLRLACLALGVLTLSSAALPAADAPMVHYEHGIIRSVDPAAKTMVLADFKDLTGQRLLWNDQTKFLAHGKAVSPAELKAGERVRLTHTAGGDLPTIQRAHIVPDRACRQDLIPSPPDRRAGPTGGPAVPTSNNGNNHA